MLYDPKWEHQTRADPFSLASLIAWLDKQPLQDSYEYECHGQCLLARYFSAAGFKNVHMFSDYFSHGEKLPGSMGKDEAVASGRAVLISKTFNWIAIGHNRTFGGALERARAFAAKGYAH
jgi:hypothetical protein